MRLIFSIGLVVISISQLPAQTPASPTAAIPQISTSASGESKVQPDRATILFGVETRKPTAAQAGAENARRQRAVLDTLRKLGLTEAQLSTSGYSVTPEMRYDGKQPQVTGYIARNVVQADVRRIEQVGPLIDGALGAGANMVNSLRFFSSRADEARRLALADAVVKARSDAEAMAKAAGGMLGPLIEMSTAGDVRPVAYDVMVSARMAAAENAPTPIDPGEQTVMVSISARWTFLPGAK